jgi:dTDP-3-amino-3,4,6-trideoxy-alpha-D-glucose transaminase
VSERAVPFLDLRPGDDAADVRAAIERVVARGWFVLGPEVEAFEAEFAAATGARHAVGVATGTDAIALLLRAAGVGAGDEVLVPAMTAAYTGLAVTSLGARPVFVDIDPARATMDPRACEDAITPRTRAMVPVHLYGQAAAMRPLRDVATRHRLALVEDCCQAHLATCDGAPVGTFGIGGAFSFYPTKNLGALGDGGAVVTNDAAVAERIRRLRNGGQRDRYHHVEAGINSRLDEMQAAVLRARLPRLHELTARRRALAAAYRRQLPDSLQPVREFDTGHVYHLFPVRTAERDRLQAHLRAAGIETLIHYPVALPDQQAFASFTPAPCREASRLAGEVLSLPLHPRLTDSDISRVCEAAGAFQKGRVLA